MSYECCGAETRASTFRDMMAALTHLTGDSRSIEGQLNFFGHNISFVVAAGVVVTGAVLIAIISSRRRHFT